MSENLNKIIAQYGTVKGKLIDTTRPVERRDEQNRPDAQVKVSKVMTDEDIAHCPPSDNDWLVAFNDHSQHSTVIGLLDEAIAASEPCEPYRYPTTPPPSEVRIK